MRRRPPRGAARAALALTLGGLLAGGSACQSHGPAAPPLQPARLQAASPACLAVLRAEAAALTGQSVGVLGAQAFADSDTLWLAAGQVRGPDGAPRDGNSLARPQALKLLSEGEGSCVLRLAGEGRSVRLAAACRCTPWAGPSR